MAAVKITKKLIESTEPGERDIIVWDSEVRGLFLKVTPAGRRTFGVFYRTLQGEQRKPALGAFGVLTVEQARDMARDMLAEVRAGRDPSKARQDARAAPTVADACKRFLDEHAARKKPLTQRQYRWLINDYVLPAMGTRKVASITHNDVAKLVTGLGKDHPTAANRLRAVLRKMFLLCERWGMRAANSNPVAHVDRYKERQRHRDLTDEELERLSDAFAADENPRAIQALRLLMLTGCRKNEILRLTWPEVRFDRKHLDLKDSKGGAKVVYLNIAALDVLEELKAAKPEGAVYVFPGEHPNKPLSDIRHVWLRVCNAAGIEGMRIHDLRHNFASRAAAKGLSLPQIGALLGHKSPQTTARYAQLVDSQTRMDAEVVRENLGAFGKVGEK